MHDRRFVERNRKVVDQDLQAELGMEDVQPPMLFVATKALPFPRLAQGNDPRGVPLHHLLSSSWWKCLSKHGKRLLRNQHLSPLSLFAAECLAEIALFLRLRIKVPTLQN
jgi:hypothetical protein